MQAAYLFLPLILSFFLFFSQEEAVDEIRFESYSRGYQKSIVLRPDSILISEQNPKTGDVETGRKTENAEWEQLTQAVAGLSLSDISELEAPTAGRASDRALHSSLTIKTNSGEYKSREFDGYNPHKKLDPLVQQIREIENKSKPSDSN